MKSAIDIITKFKKDKQATQRGLSKQYENTKQCQAFYAGDMMDYKDKIQFVTRDGQKKRAMVQFQKVKPYVNAVKGFMAQNRREGKYLARVNGDKVQSLYSQYANAMKEYCRDKANADQGETQQDGDMLINGYGAVDTAVSYGEGYATDDPNGSILMGRLDPLQLGWDPYAKSPNLLDARWVYYQKDYAQEDALQLFSDSKPEDFQSSNEDDSAADAGYRWYPKGGRYNMIKEADSDWEDEKSQMVKVYFYQWLEVEEFFRADNPLYTLNSQVAVAAADAQLQMIAATEPEEAEEFGFNPREEIMSFGPKIKKLMDKHFGKFVESVPFNRKAFYTAVIGNDKVFTSYKNICQKGFTIKFKTGDYDSKNKIWVGMVNCMMEPTLYYNKALTEMMFTIGANSKGGVLVETSAVEDIAEFEKQYAKTDGAIEVADGALAEGRIKPKREGYAPTGYEQVIQLSEAAVPEAVGIDKSFLGSSENKDETGVLQRRRIKQVVSALACYFDSITLYQKEQSRLMLDLMRVWAQNNSGGMFHIVGPNGKAQFLKISSDKLAPDYDVMIAEAPQSAEEKLEQGAKIQGIGDKLIAAGDLQSAKILYSISLKYMQLDDEDLQKIMEVLVPQDGHIDPAFVKQMHDQLQALMSEQNQVALKEQLSKIALNMASVTEKTARAHELAAKSNKENASAVKTTMESSMIGKPGVETTVTV